MLKFDIVIHGSINSFEWKLRFIFIECTNTLSHGIGALWAFRNIQKHFRVNNRVFRCKLLDQRLYLGP